MDSTTHNTTQEATAMTTTNVIDLSSGELPSLKYARTQYNSSETWRLYDYEAQTDDGYRVEIDRDRDLADKATSWPFICRVYYSADGTGDDEVRIMTHRGTLYNLKKHAAYAIKSHRYAIDNPDVIELLRATRSVKASA